MKKSVDDTRSNDRAISWLLASIWLGGLILIRNIREDIPLTMLVIGTVFFLVLIPAMKEIARNLERFFASHFSDKID